MERTPGQPFDLTDEEILSVPPRMLTKAQRVRRRVLRNKAAKERSRAARRHRMDMGRAKVIYCQAKTKRGYPCGSYAMDGAKHCKAHLNSAEKAKLGVGSLGDDARARKAQREQERLTATTMNGGVMTGPQMGRSTFEVAVSKIISRYFAALGMEFKGFDENNEPIVYDHGAEKGLRLYGESKDGYIHVSEHPDLLAQIQVAEKLWDRIYGKPKQTQVLEGGTRPIQVQPVRTVERAQRLAEVIAANGGIVPPGLNAGVADPGLNNGVAGQQEEVIEGEARVIPLRRETEHDGDEE